MSTMGSCQSIAPCIYSQLCNCMMGTISNLPMFNSFHFFITTKAVKQKQNLQVFNCLLPLSSLVPWHKCGQQLLLWFWQHHSLINEIQVHKAQYWYITQCTFCICNVMCSNYWREASPPWCPISSAFHLLWDINLKVDGRQAIRLT